MTDDLGVELTAVKTNIRDVVRHWGMSFGSVVAETLSFSQKSTFMTLPVTTHTKSFTCHGE